MRAGRKTLTLGLVLLAACSDPLGTSTERPFEPAALLTGTLIVDTGQPTFMGSGASVSNQSDATRQFVAGRFTLEEPATVTGLEVWMGIIAGGQIEISIRADDGGLPADGSIRTEAYSPDARPLGVEEWIEFADFGPVELAPGMYWVVLMPPLDSEFRGYTPPDPPNPLERYAFKNLNTLGDVWVPTPPGIQEWGLRVYGEDVDPYERAMETIEALVDAGVLNGGQANALLTKLDMVATRVEEGKLNAALGQIDAFLNQVRSFIDDGVLPPDVGADLLALGNRIRDDILAM